MVNLETTMQKVEIEEGFMHWGRIPFKIWVETESETCDLVSPENPGHHRITPDMGGGQSLSIYVHESVPKEYLDNVIYHELAEAELKFVYGISGEEAHKRAVNLEGEYVERFHGMEKSSAFRIWRENLSDS